MSNGEDKIEARRKLRKALVRELGPVIAGGLAAGILAMVMLSLLKSTPPTKFTVQIPELDALRAQVIEERKDLDALRARVEALRSLPIESNALVHVAAIRGDVQVLDGRVKAIESAVLNNPTLALSFPLLRQDLENLKTEYRKDAAYSASQIDRIYDQNKWFIGLMVTSAFGILALAISNFYQARRER